MNMKSRFMTLNARDFIKAIIMAFISGILTGIYKLLQSGTIFSWTSLKLIAISGVSAVIAYLIKNFFTNSKDEFMTKESAPVKNLQNP